LQKRKWLSNAVLLAAPFLICMLLWVLQDVINQQLDARSFRCGCKCLSCCDWAYNDSECGFLFSTTDQAGFCAVEEPPLWPALLEVPQEQHRGPKAANVMPAALPTPPSIPPTDAPMLYTGADPAEAQRLMEAMWGRAASISDAVLAAYSAAQAQGEAVPTSTEGQAISSEHDFRHSACLLHPLCPQAITNMTGFPVECASLAPAWQVDASWINDQVYLPPEAAAGPDGSPSSQSFVSALYDWSNTSAAGLNVTVWVNNSDVGGGEEGGVHPPSVQRWSQPINLAANAFLKRQLGPAHSARLVGVKDMPRGSSRLSLDFSSLLGPLFSMWLLQLMLPVGVHTLVQEKEQHLRVMMKMQASAAGLSDSVFYLVMYCWNLALYCAFVAVFCLFGGLIGLKIFTLNSYSLQATFYFLWGLALTSWTFYFSALWREARPAVLLAVIWLIISGWAAWRYRGLYELSQYAFLADRTGGSGLTWSKLGEAGNGMVSVLLMCAVEAVVFMWLAYYLEQVRGAGTGIRRHRLFFLGFKLREKEAPERRRWLAGWRRRRRAAQDGGGTAKGSASARQLLAQPPAAIVLRSLRKVFPARDGNAEKVAVADLSLAVPRCECFGLLGPNGAGKTTTIRMMEGFMSATSGQALIEGLDIGRDMDDIYALMGACPQHDLLWDGLTVREHLLFYARIKNFAGKRLRRAVDDALRSVNLFTVGNDLVGGYSGGMKRRLSVAISLVGDPLVVYLDEPSTGLDPASRQLLWNVIRQARRERAVVLTTHSMEEAEALCDRLGIFVGGRLQCLGNPKDLVSRFGGYLSFTITTPVGQEAAAAAVVRGLSPSARLVYALGGTQKFELPVGEAGVDQIFSRMEEVKARRELDLVDWGVSNATLEEVFIRITRDAGVRMGAFA
ncbi:hypothetical protein CHLNCDRAFT_23609, partial [Chlorella variabilis]